MAVLTHKEYSDLNKDENKNTVEGSGGISLPTPVIKPKKIEYHLFHPDGYMNNKYIVQIGAKKFNFDINNGVIVTDDEEVKIHLIRQGFSLLYEKEIQNGH